MKKHSLFAFILTFLSACSHQQTVESYNASPEPINYEEKALQLYGNAEKTGNAKEINRLGVMYYYGFGVPKDESKARFLWHLSGLLGYGGAYCNLGYLSAENIKTYKQAYTFFQSATQAKTDNSCGYSGLGYAYLWGIGVKPDLKSAEEYSLFARSIGEPTKSPEINLKAIAEKRGDRDTASKWQAIIGNEENEPVLSRLIRILEL